MLRAMLSLPQIYAGISLRLTQAGQFRQGAAWAEERSSRARIASKRPLPARSGCAYRNSTGITNTSFVPSPGHALSLALPNQLKLTRITKSPAKGRRHRSIRIHD
jgi:hypothetical protein